MVFVDIIRVMSIWGGNLNKKVVKRLKEGESEGRRYGSKHAESSPMFLAAILLPVAAVGVAGYFVVKHGFKALDKR